MVFKFYKFSRTLHSLVNISRINNMNQEKCYFRYIQNEDKINICFLFQVRDSVRQFNLSRQSTENLQTLCTRIATNIQKVVCKKNKKKQQNDHDEIVVQVYDHMCNPLPPELSCSELFNFKTPIKINISNNIYDIVFNAPWITNYNLPKCIMAGFPVYPENFETQFTERNLSVFNWYKGKAQNEKKNEISDIHIKWQFIENNFYYTPTGEDIGMKLKLECIPVNSSSIGPSVEEVSKVFVEAGPGYCPFETRHMLTATSLTDKSFRCVSYNILADLYCDSDFTRTVLHPYCPPYALHIDYRKQLILKELLGYHADIICLQEVDNKVFLNCLQPIFENNELDGLFFKKGKTVAEGLACFYNNKRFKLLEHKYILLAEAIKNELCLAPIWDKVKNNAPLLQRLLDRSTVVGATILQSTESLNEVVIVGNTHLYFHPDADHIRLIQGGIVIYWLKQLKNDMTQKWPGKRISIILCGDFNSVPSCGIYNLYTTGEASDSLPDWRSNFNEAVSGLTLKQDIPLESACGTPQYTNFTEGFADCLDYIFYEKTNLKVEQVVPFPSIEELKANTAIPSIVFPSDHIAIISDLQFL